MLLWGATTCWSYLLSPANPVRHAAPGGDA